MKKFVTLCLCFGCIVLNLTGCEDDKKTDNDACSFEGLQCSDDGTQLLKCEDGAETVAENCANGCENGACKPNTPPSCSYEGNKCSDDGTKVVKCDKGLESTVDTCANGCENAACKPNTEPSCSYEGNKCSDDGTKVVKCEGGEESTVETCANGCDNATCKPAASCNYEGNKCSDDGTKVVKCEGGEESTVDTCTNGCENATCRPSTSSCNYQGNKCSDDGTKVLKCEGGSESIVDNCTNGCENGACKPPCNYTGTKCSEDGKQKLTCKTGNESSEACENGCENGECVDPSLCNFSGKGCRKLESKHQVVKCDDDKNFIVLDNCIGTCTNGACDKVKCPPSVNKSCYDANTILECNAATNEMVKTPCPTDKLCTNGECFDGSVISTCDFEPSCTADSTAIRKCDAGKTKYENCPPKTACSDDNGTPECVSTVNGNKCNEDTFIPYCDEYNHAISCQDEYLHDDNCGTIKKCINGNCIKEVHIGDDCNVEKFIDTCVGTIPVTCKKTSGTDGKVTASGDDCANSDSICGVTIIDTVPMIRCFEPCNEVGQKRDTCIDDGAETYQSVYECIQVDYGIGDKRLGYELEAGTLQLCDIGCKEGKCFDYTQGITGIGEECVPENFTGYCKNNVAVACEFDPNQSKDLITAELCDYDEACAAYKDGDNNIAKCLKQCRQGDQPQYKCQEFSISGSNTIYSSQAYTCVKIGDVYVWQADPDPEKYSLCRNGCGEDGKCL